MIFFSQKRASGQKDEMSVSNEPEQVDGRRGHVARIDSYVNSIWF